MGVETWLADGWNIESANLRKWEYRDGTDQVTLPAQKNPTVANRTGELWRPKTLGAGQFTLGMWLVGSNRSDIEASYNLLLRAFVRPHKLIHMTRTRSNGQVVTCDAELIGSIKPVNMGQRGMRCSFDFNVPAGVWKGAAATPASTSFGTLPRTVNLPGLADATAATEDATLTITGPITNPLITETTETGGQWVQWVGTLASSATVVLNSGTWAATLPSGNLSAIRFSGRRYLPIAPPRPGQTPQLTLSGTGGDFTHTMLRVDYAPSYVI